MDNKDLNFKVELLIDELRRYKGDREDQLNTNKRMIELYKSKLSILEKDIADKEQYIKTQITNLLDENFDKMKETKTEFNYKTPSAKVFFKKQQNVMKLKENFNENEIPSRFIKVERSVNWAGFKALLKIVDNNVINQQTGEIVESVDIELKPESELNIKIL